MSSIPSKAKRVKKGVSKHPIKSGTKPGSEIYYNLTHPTIKIRPIYKVKPIPRVVLPEEVPPPPGIVPIVREVVRITIEEALKPYQQYRLLNQGSRVSNTPPRSASPSNQTNPSF